MKLTQDDARAIAKKLKADIEPGTRHDKAIIRCDGRLVTWYGIRRSSHSVGHGHIPKQLKVSPRQTRELAQCSLDKDSYFALLDAKGEIPESDTPPKSS